MIIKINKIVEKIIYIINDNNLNFIKSCMKEKETKRTNEFIHYNIL